MNTTSISLEAFLARLYTDAALRSAFLNDPAGVARDAGLDAADGAALIQIDRAGLQMAAASYARKRAQHKAPKKSLREIWGAWRGK